MTRSILCGLFGLLSVVTIGVLPIGCQSGGVGDPCTPEDEYSPDFAGFKVTEENIESRSFQCATRICLVNHFQGRVSCPLGQDAVDMGGTRHSCNGPTDTSCPKLTAPACDPTGKDKTKPSCTQKCVEASTLSPDCSTDADCAGVAGTHCDKKRKLCTCTSGGTLPPGYFCDKDSILKNYVCHAEGNCQTSESKVVRDTKTGMITQDDRTKDCCVPGTDTPVVAPVCGQCDSKKGRNAEQAVYCSCRCDVADGEPKDPNFNFCTCPTGFTCSQIRRNVGLGDAQITGKYCIKEGTAFDGNPFSCGQVDGHFDSTCRGIASLAGGSGSQTP